MNTPPCPIRQVILGEQLQTFRPFWNVYSCNVELIDGTIIENCSIESDSLGNDMSFDSLMDEAGNLFDTWTFTLKPE